MKDFQAILRRLDAEITGHRQEIATRQVLIARAEDARRTLMSIAENDAADAEAAKLAGGHLMNGSHAKPMLIVRKTTEDAPKKKSGRGGRRIKGPGSELQKMRVRILDAIKPGDEPVASGDLADKLGLPIGEHHRKPMQNALYQMRVKGELDRDGEKRYFRRAVQ